MLTQDPSNRFLFISGVGVLGLAGGVQGRTDLGGCWG